MARVPLYGLRLTPDQLRAAAEGGSNQTFRLTTASGSNAVVYAASTGATVLTSPYQIKFQQPQGWVDEGEYILNVQGYSSGQELHAGDLATATANGFNPFLDPITTLQNYDWQRITVITCSNVSQTIKFVRIVPLYAKTAAKIVSISGSTAAA